MTLGQAWLHTPQANWAWDPKHGQRPLHECDHPDSNHTWKMIWINIRLIDILAQEDLSTYFYFWVPRHNRHNHNIRPKVLGTPHDLLWDFDDQNGLAKNQMPLRLCKKDNLGRRPPLQWETCCYKLSLGVHALHVYDYICDEWWWYRLDIMCEMSKSWSSQPYALVLGNKNWNV